jgi:hypothetical protein
MLPTEISKKFILHYTQKKAKIYGLAPPCNDLTCVAGDTKVGWSFGSTESINSISREIGSDLDDCRRGL